MCLIDFYLEWDSDLEALYDDSPTYWELVSYEDVLDDPSSSEVDPADLECISSEDQSYRETECIVSSHMKWSFIPELEYVCPHQDNPSTAGLMP